MVIANKYFAGAHDVMQHARAAIRFQNRFYNNFVNSRVLIGSFLWYIRVQTIKM